VYRRGWEFARQIHRALHENLYRSQDTSPPSYTVWVRQAQGYVGRLAPSPTGLLHLGHVRTFATAWTRARAAQGRVYLRIDDLDPQRSSGPFAETAKEDLVWLGLDWDRLPAAAAAANGVWFQSRRTPAYRDAWEQLVAQGHAYPCSCSRRDLRAAAAAPHEQGPESAQPVQVDEEPLYPGTCRPAWLDPPTKALGAAEEDRQRWLAAGPDGANWRFRVPDGIEIGWNDSGFGPQGFVAGRDFGDFSLWRRDGIAAYQLATVVDDAAMGITEVVRGADLLLSTARQLLLYRALGLAVPAFHHCPLIVDAQGDRLAKRSDALSVRALRERGCTPEEVLTLAHTLNTADAR
jgi:glutamyl/glutaminyl-tRNA synthetase